jgi:hypothetical protein
MSFVRVAEMSINLGSFHSIKCLQNIKECTQQSTMLERGCIGPLKMFTGGSESLQYSFSQQTNV